MPQVRLERGLVLIISGQRCEYLRVLEDGCIQFENVRTGGIQLIPHADVVRNISTGEYAVDGVITQKIVEHQGRFSKNSEVPLIELSAKQLSKKLKQRVYLAAIIRGGGRSLTLRMQMDIVRRTAEQLGDIKAPSETTIYRLLKKSLDVECLGTPMVAAKKRCGRVASLQAEEPLMWSALRTHYFVRNGRDLRHAYDMYRADRRPAKERAGDGANKEASFSTFKRLAKTVSGYERDKARLGNVAARNKWRHAVGGVYATRPLERVALDHTTLDIYVIDDDFGMVLGRPIITILVDEFSRYILGMHLSFHGESLCRVAEAIKFALTPKDEIKKRLNLDRDWVTPGVWETLVVDNALAHHAGRFEQISSELGCNWEYGPVHMPWFKGSVERAIGRVNRALPSQGKPEKGSGPGRIDPKKTARIKFSDLVRCLFSWAVGEYALANSERNIMCPLEKLMEGLKDAPPPIYVSDLDVLDVITGDESEATVRQYGVERRHLSYRSPELAELAQRQQKPVFKIRVRTNPENLGSIWVHDSMNQKWLKVPCMQARYAEGLSWRKHTHIRKVLQARRKLSGLEDDYLKAKAELSTMWSDALLHGRSLRKVADLARIEGVSSKKVAATTQLIAGEQAPEEGQIIDQVGELNRQEPQSLSRFAAAEVVDLEPPLNSDFYKTGVVTDLPYRDLGDVSEPIPVYESMNPKRDSLA